MNWILLVQYHTLTQCFDNSSVNITLLLCFDLSALGIQEMGIPEAITHAIEQLPIGESLM